jgi:hypothetical protein
MSLNQLYKQRQAKPAPTPTEPPPVSRNLCGPETVVGTVREITIHSVVKATCRLWNCPSDRTYYVMPVELIERLLDAGTNTPVSVTVEKLRGRWTVTKVEQVTT